MRTRKKYKMKPRFFIVVAVILCLLLAGVVLLLRGCSGGDDNQMQIDILRTQQLQGKKMMTAARIYISNKDLHYDDGYYAGGLSS